MYYKIDGVKMPGDITKFKYVPTDMYSEATGRDEAGHNHLDLIRPKVRSWDVQHEMLTRAEIDLIVSALDPLGFDFEGEDSSGKVHAHCYGTIQSINATAYFDDSPEGSYWTITLSFIEN